LLFQHAVTKGNVGWNEEPFCRDQSIRKSLKQLEEYGSDGTEEHVSVN
jgi:hypothetical protein